MSRAGNWTAVAGTRTREPDEKLTRPYSRKTPYERDRNCGGRISKTEGRLWPWANVSGGEVRFGPDDARLAIVHRAYAMRKTLSAHSSGEMTQGQ